MCSVYDWCKGSAQTTCSCSFFNIIKYTKGIYEYSLNDYQLKYGIKKGKERKMIIP